MQTETMKLKEVVFSVFENACDQREALLEIYRLLSPGVLPDSGRKALCGHRIYRFITGQFCAFDREKHPERPPGGLWFKKGFERSGLIPDWQVVIALVADTDERNCFA
jgi:hypothetical protein